MSACVSIREDWITAVAASAIVGVCHVTFPKVALAGKVRRKILPGCKAKYSREDVEAIAASAIVTVGRQNRGVTRRKANP